MPSPWYRKPLDATNIDAPLDKHAGGQHFPQTGEERSKNKDLNAFSDYNNDQEGEGGGHTHPPLGEPKEV